MTTSALNPQKGYNDGGNVNDNVGEGVGEGVVGGVGEGVVGGKCERTVRPCVLCVCCCVRPCVLLRVRVRFPHPDGFPPMPLSPTASLPAIAI